MVNAIAGCSRLPFIENTWGGYEQENTWIRKGGGGVKLEMYETKGPKSTLWWLTTHEGWKQSPGQTLLQITPAYVSFKHNSSPPGSDHFQRILNSSGRPRPPQIRGRQLVRLRLKGIAWGGGGDEKNWKIMNQRDWLTTHEGWKEQKTKTKPRPVASVEGKVNKGKPPPPNLLQSSPPRMWTVPKSTAARGSRGMEEPIS